VTFWKRLLCLDGRPCSAKAHLDVFAHHPYSLYGPTVRAFYKTDAGVADLHRLTALFGRATARGTVLPRGRKPFWITEFSWETNPPDRKAGVALATQARWLAEALHIFWRDGVQRAVWFGLRDDAPVPDVNHSFQNGLYFRSGKAKPAVRAFRFPVAVSGRGGRRTIWGLAPGAGRVLIEVRAGSRWQTIKRVERRADGTFGASLPAHGTVRAEQGVLSSLAWPG
jgi:hypothetical protein